MREVKRKAPNFNGGTANDLWMAWVWGTPLALVLAAAAGMIGLSPLLAFIAGLAFSAGLSLLFKDEHRTRQILMFVLSTTLLSVGAMHWIQFCMQHGNTVAAAIDAAAIFAALVVAYAALKSRSAVASR